MKRTSGDPEASKLQHGQKSLVDSLNTLEDDGIMPWLFAKPGMIMVNACNGRRARIMQVLSNAELLVEESSWAKMALLAVLLFVLMFIVSGCVPAANAEAAMCQFAESLQISNG